MTSQRQWPSYKEITDALLSLIANAPDKRIIPSQAYDSLAQHFIHNRQLPSTALEERTETGANRWKVTVQFARKNLVDDKLLKREVRGVWELNEKGIERYNQLSAQQLIPLVSLTSTQAGTINPLEDVEASTYVTKKELVPHQLNSARCADPHEQG